MPFGPGRIGVGFVFRIYVGLLSFAGCKTVSIVPNTSAVLQKWHIWTYYNHTRQFPKILGLIPGRLGFYYDKALLSKRFAAKDACQMPIH